MLYIIIVVVFHSWYYKVLFKLIANITSMKNMTILKKIVIVRKDIFISLGYLLINCLFDYYIIFSGDSRGGIRLATAEIVGYFVAIFISIINFNMSKNKKVTE